MAVVKTDMLEGTRGTKDYSGWTDIDRIIIVDALVQTSFENKVNEAIAAAGLTFGDPHPNISYIYLVRIEPKSLSKSMVELTCVYSRIKWTIERFEDGAIECGASLVQQEVSLDKDGSEMTVSFTYPVGYQRSPHDEPLKSGDYATENADVQAVFTSKMVPQLVWSKNKIENESPEEEAAEYVGWINSSSWRGYAARTWLCVRIQGRSTDGGHKYNTIKEFQYNPDTWDLTATYIMDNGKAVPNPDIDAKKTFKIYGEKNFNSINL